MQRLFRAVKIVSPGSVHHGQVWDILVDQGTITAIGTDLSNEDAEVIELPGAHVSSGWIDLEAEGGDPGLEQREDTTSLLRAAAAGGYAQVGLRPQAEPPIHDKSGVHYLLQQANGSVTSILPIGAISRSIAGEDITEMLDMKAAGALAFSDGSHPVQLGGLMLRALQYAKSFDGLVLNQPLEQSIAGNGQMHEGSMSTRLGMRGIPALAEQMMIERDLSLLEYAESRLHISHVSTAAGVGLIRAAKAKGLKVTASVATLNLLLTDEDLSEFDSHCKVLPPLRAETDRRALLEGLEDGTIDCIASNHCPRELERKLLEFAYADFGAATLSTAFATARTGAKNLSEEVLLSKFTSGPRRVLGLPEHIINENAPASLTFYRFAEDWTVQAADIRSKSANSPLIGRKLTGRPLAVLNGERFYLHSK
ncbi:MAG: dihydroorotase [Bacteroidota bacterium]